MSLRNTGIFAASTALALMVAIAAPSVAQMNDKTVMVGGAAMYPSKNIVENAMNSKDHTTLVAAVKAADLVATLQSAGPFTVFAPTNEAFGKLPAGTVDNLVKPENKPTLTKVLTYHVVAGRYTAHDLMDMVKKGGGKAELKTVEGETLTIWQQGDKLGVNDSKNNTAWVSIPDVMQSNGVIHGFLNRAKGGLALGDVERRAKNNQRERENRGIEQSEA